MILLKSKSTVVTMENIKITDSTGKDALSFTKINLSQVQRKEVPKC